MDGGLCAIMGPSGSGKSTLLDALAGRKNPDRITGVITVDGKLQPTNFKCTSGYVQQEDKVYGLLTVKENLYFSAVLRNPKCEAKKTKRRVEEVLEQLRLKEKMDCRVGTEFNRGISGGEKRRLSIAVELVRETSVLFLDEPTTGLDSSTAQVLIEILKKLADSGKTVILSLHQPKFGIYRQFDSLTLVNKGDIVYNGIGGDVALEYFKSLGYDHEQNDNPADYYLDVLLDCKTRQSAHQNEDTSEFLRKNWMQSEQFKKVEEFLTDDYRLAKQSETQVRGKKDGITYATGCCLQMGILCYRTFLNMMRDINASVIQGLVYLFFAIAMGVVYFQVDTSLESGLQNRAGFFFFSCLQVIYVNLGAVEAFLKERRFFQNERTAGWYRVITYFFAKLICEILPTKVLPIICFLPITYFMVGLQKSFGQFLVFEILLNLTTLCAASIVFCVSASVSSFATANTVISIIFIFMVVFGGYLINLNTLFSGLSWLKYLSIFRYCWNGLLVNELSALIFCPSNNTLPAPNNTTDPPFMPATLKLDATRNCTTGQQYLYDLGIPQGSSWALWQNIVALGVIAMILLTLCYIQLRRVSKWT
ncbi:hypothetical protein Ciccas_006910 [Cichlidogyrus casuarinus]|uniref:ABC transporter domain-containing protein n=1 Tax=Cichlidogyrus casuarinus TaxID=1844966 RepID=A0ABD2Q8A7_9PLAT